MLAIFDASFLMIFNLFFFTIRATYAWEFRRWIIIIIVMFFYFFWEGGGLHVSFWAGSTLEIRYSLNTESILYGPTSFLIVYIILTFFIWTTQSKVSVSSSLSTRQNTIWTNATNAERKSKNTWTACTTTTKATRKFDSGLSPTTAGFSSWRYWEAQIALLMRR